MTARCRSASWRSTNSAPTATSSIASIRSTAPRSSGARRGRRSRGGLVAAARRGRGRALLGLVVLLAREAADVAEQLLEEAQAVAGGRRLAVVHRDPSRALPAALLEDLPAARLV